MPTINVVVSHSPLNLTEVQIAWSGERDTTPLFWGSDEMMTLTDDERDAVTFLIGKLQTSHLAPAVAVPTPPAAPAPAPARRLTFERVLIAALTASLIAQALF